MKNKLKSSSAFVPVIPELALQDHEGTPYYGDYGHPTIIPAAPIRPPDRRAEDGNVFDLHNEITTL